MSGQPPSQPQNGFGFAAIVLGVVSLPLILQPWFGIVVGALAIVLGVLGNVRASSGDATNGPLARNGAVLGGFGIIGSIIFMIVN